MLSLVLGAICFAGIHLGVAGTTLRDRAITALGEGAYRAVSIDAKAVAHLVANGDVASFVFFGAFAVTALAAHAQPI
jgi:uncharacterized membrane protein